MIIKSSSKNGCKRALKLYRLLQRNFHPGIHTELRKERLMLFPVQVQKWFFILTVKVVGSDDSDSQKFFENLYEMSPNPQL